MTNIKVRNINKKSSREICYAPPQRPPSDWLCPTADNSVSSQQLAPRAGITEIILIFSSDQLYFSVSVNHISKGREMTFGKTQAGDWQHSRYLLASQRPALVFKLGSLAFFSAVSTKIIPGRFFTFETTH